MSRLFPQRLAKSLERTATMNTTFHCDGFRPIKQDAEIGFSIIETAQDAARVFADRWAKRLYGKKGYCHHVRLDCYAADGRYSNFEAFVGHDCGDGCCSGRNVQLSVVVRR